MAVPNEFSRTRRNRRHFADHWEHVFFEMHFIPQHNAKGVGSDDRLPGSDRLRAKKIAARVSVGSTCSPETFFFFKQGKNRLDRRAHRDGFVGIHVVNHRRRW